MPGNYHIIHADANYVAMRVPCEEGGPYHQHQTHTEEVVASVCGVTLATKGDDFCSIDIADPNWNHDWCHDCVRSFPWTAEARRLWLEKGIDTEGE